MRQTIKLNESQLRNIIKEQILDFFKKDNNYQLKSLQAKEEFIKVCYLYDKCFDGFSPEWFYKYIIGTGLNPECSVLAVTSNNDIIGACIVTEEEFPFELLKNKNLSQILENNKYKCISVLAVKPEFRGGKLNYEIVTKTINNLISEGCQWAYIQVFTFLKTHEYWKRYGAVEVLDSEGVKHYVLPLTEEFKRELEKI